MDVAGWMDTILQGVLLGGLYALFATGLALVFGVMRLVNLAHGDLIILSAYLVMAAAQATGLPLITAFPLVVLVMAVLGYVLQRGLFNFVLKGEDVLRPLLVTFGLSIVIENALLESFSADTQHLIVGPLNTASFEIMPGLIAGVLPLISLAAAIAVLGALHFMLYHTQMGRMFRATSDDPEIASAMGVQTARVFGQASAIAFAVIAVAGLMLGLRTSFEPSAGPGTLLFAFEAVIIGGLGNLWGTLLGGIILGLAQATASRFDPNWQVLAGHLVFIVLLVFKPNGLLPRVEHR